MTIVALVFVFVGLFLSVIFMMMPVLSLWVLLCMSMLVSGTVSYFFPQFSNIQWSVALVSFVLLARVALSMITTGTAKEGRVPPFFKYFVVLAASVLLTTFFNRHLSETAVSAKNLFQFWSVPLVLYFIVKDDKTSTAIMKVFLWIAIVQPPLAVVQRALFPAKIPGDAVTGTFGGQMMGGGPNAALSVFLTIQIGLLLALSMRKLLPWRYAILGSLWLLIPILLTNAKAIIFFFPVMIVLLFKDNILRKPAVAVVGTVLFLVFMGTVTMYHKYDWQKSSPAGFKTSVSNYLKIIVNKNVATKRSTDLNRVTVCTYWWQENVRRYGVVQILFGHGLGATKRAGLITGHIQAKREYRDRLLGYTALSTLLWEIGLVGTLFYCLIFSSAFFLAGRLKKHPNLEETHQVFLSVAQVACLFLLMTLPYKLSILNVQSFNAYSMFVLGYLAFWSKKLAHDPVPSVPAQVVLSDAGSG